jgi:hypothetical protein
MRSLPPSVRGNPQVSETPFCTITSINPMGAIPETFHQWLIVCSATVMNRHARRAGSLTCQRQSQLNSRDGKCPGVRRNVLKTRCRCMTPHLRRLPKLGNMFLDLRRLFRSIWGDRSWGLHLWHSKWLPVKLVRAIIVTCQGAWICITRR